MTEESTLLDIFWEGNLGIFSDNTVHLYYSSRNRRRDTMFHFSGNLPEIELVQKTNSVDKDFECSICMETYPNTDITLQCNHSYCFQCVSSYITKCIHKKQNPTCALCRADYATITFHNKDHLKSIEKILEY